MSFLSGVLLLFLVMDPLGNIPLFLATLKDVDEKRRIKVIFRELLIALIVLMCFLFFGRYLMEILEIKKPALNIAGGIVLFIIAIKMVFPVQEGLGMFGAQPSGEPLIVPLAIPLIAGPSAMTTILILTSREPDKLYFWFAALLCAWLISTIILLFSTFLSVILKEKGLIALERLMGMILITIAIQMSISGIEQLIR